MDGVWNPATSDEVRDAVLGTDLAYAASAWQGLQPQLHAYASAWQTARLQTCLGRPELPVALHEVQDECFDGRRDDLANWIEILRTPDAAVINRAVSVMRRWSIDDCADAEQLAKRDPLPDDPVLRARARQMVGQLSRARLSRSAGRLDEGLALAQAGLEGARELDIVRYRAMALRVYAAALGEFERYDEAVPAYEESFFLARSIGDEEGAAVSAGSLTRMVGAGQLRFEDGRRWSRHAATSLTLSDAPALAWADHYEAVSSVEFVAGNYALARDHAERALAEYERLVEPDSDELLEPLSFLGSIYSRLGKIEQAREVSSRALDIAKRRYGPAHPRVAECLNNLGAVYLESAAFESAEAQFRKAAEIRGNLGLVTQQLRTLTNLSTALRLQGKLTEAREILDQTLETDSNVYGDDYALAMALLTRGQALESLEQRKKALSDYERALALYERTLGPEHAETADVVYTLAVALLRDGQSERALQMAKRGFATYAREFGPDHPKFLLGLQLIAGVAAQLRECEPLVEAVEPHIDKVDDAAGSIGEKQLVFLGYTVCLREVRGAAAAVPYARRAVELAEDSTVGKLNAFAARFELGRTLWEAGQRDEGGPMARQAYADIVALDDPTPGAEADTGEYAQWLVDNAGLPLRK